MAIDPRWSKRLAIISMADSQASRIMSCFCARTLFSNSDKVRAAAPTATVRQVLQGLTMIPIVSCFNCDGWTMNTVSLFSHLRSVSQTRTLNP